MFLNYKPNVKAPKQLNPSNVEVWVNGQISRILGLMNSCPASVAGLYNFGLSPGQSSSLTIENIVKSIPLPNKPTWLYVVWSFRVILGIVKKDPDGITTRTDMRPLVFNESPITVSGSSKLNSIGITPLEDQMFSRELVTRDGRITPGIEIKRELNPSTLVLPDKETKVRSLDMQELEVFLTSLELASYRSAYKLGNKSRLVSLNKTAAARKAQSENPQTQPQTIKPEDEQISLGEFARETSSSRRRRGRPRSGSSSPSATRASSPRISPSDGPVAEAEESATDGATPDVDSLSADATSQNNATGNE
jgi:hypothetical protein